MFHQRKMYSVISAVCHPEAELNYLESLAPRIKIISCSCAANSTKKV